MKEANRVALYARVSTRKGQDVSMQLRDLRELCARRKWKIVSEFVDRGISGAVDSRPELNRLMEEAHKGKFSIVVVWKFDRFARSVSHLLKALETFRSLGIEFVSFSDGEIDTTTAAGKMVFTVLGAVGELERSLIGERVRSGLRNAAAKGVRLGRPPLKNLTASEIRQLRRDRRRARTSFSTLAHKYGVSVWTAFQLCKRGIRNV